MKFILFIQKLKLIRERKYCNLMGCNFKWAWRDSFLLCMKVFHRTMIGVLNLIHYILEIIEIKSIYEHLILSESTYLKFSAEKQSWSKVQDHYLNSL